MNWDNLFHVPSLQFPFMFLNCACEICVKSGLGPHSFSCLKTSFECSLESVRGKASQHFCQRWKVEQRDKRSILFSLVLFFFSLLSQCRPSLICSHCVLEWRGAWLVAGDSFYDWWGCYGSPCRPIGGKLMWARAGPGSLGHSVILPLAKKKSSNIVLQLFPGLQKCRLCAFFGFERLIPCKTEDRSWSDFEFQCLSTALVIWDFIKQSRFLSRHYSHCGCQMLCTRACVCVSMENTEPAPSCSSSFSFSLFSDAGNEHWALTRFLHGR